MVGDFGTNPSERMNPSFRQEDEHMAQELAPVVMAPPAYASPDPNTAAGRLVPVEESPHELSGDYAQDALSTPGEALGTETDYFASTRTPEELLVDGAGREAEGLDDDKRAEWSKKDWQTKARSYGLPVGGKVDVLKERVEGYEGELAADSEMNASEWVDEIDKAETEDDLASIRARYGATGAEYSTVDAAFEKAQAEFDAPDDDE